uniref:Uncharacterized protein n=1 Tax=Haemonchus contortus TaxID=6289 RepID=A0A7I4YQE6_HAECO
MPSCPFTDINQQISFICRRKTGRIFLITMLFYSTDTLGITGFAGDHQCPFGL